MNLTFRASGSIESASRWAEVRVTVDTSDSFALLALLCLPPDPFGGCDAFDFAARVRRAMWPSRNAPPKLHAVLVALLDLADRAGHDGLIVFDLSYDVATR